MFLIYANLIYVFISPMHNTERTHSTSFPRAYSNPHPSLPNVLSHDSSHLFFDGSSYPPPLVTTRFDVKEHLNTSPHLLRSSMYTIPCESHILEAVGMPFYIALQPFFPCEKRVVSKVLRCNECRSFVNCYTKYEGDGGYLCNLCGSHNQVNDYNFESLPTLEHTFEKTRIVETRKEKDELFVGDDYFSWRVFTCPILIIGIQSNERLSARVDSLLSLLTSSEFENSFGKVCIFTFGEGITIYKNTTLIEEYKICDKIPFISPDFFLDVEKAIETLIHIKDNVNSCSNKTNLNIFEIFASSSRYSFGKALLFIDYPMVVPFTFVEILGDNSFSLNLVTTCDSGLDEIVKSTCGKILTGSLFPLLTPTYYDVSVEIKTSDAIRKSSVLTHIPLENTLSIHFPSMDCNNVIGFSFFIDEAMKEGQQVFIQAIVTFSDFDSRKVIVLNHGFNASFSLTNIFSGLSFDTIFHYYARLVAEDKQNFTTIKSSIVKALRLYRHIVTKSVSDTQMVLPESIKLLPLLYSCLLKQTNVIPLCSTLSVARTLRLFYPRMFSLTDFILSNKIKLINATFTALSYSDTYVIDNGRVITIYIGREINVTEEEFLREESETILAVRELIAKEYNDDLEVRVVKMGKGDVEVVGMMVEDKMNNVSSYADFLYEMHYLIKD